MRDTGPTDIGDTESVFDVLAPEMATTTLRSAVNDGGGSPRRSRHLAARGLAEGLRRPAVERAVRLAHCRRSGITHHDLRAASRERGEALRRVAPGQLSSILELLHSRPARHRRSDKAEVGPQVVNEAESNIREEDVVEAIAGLDADPLAFQGMPYR